jgi:hypothetical protein
MINSSVSCLNTIITKIFIVDDLSFYRTLIYYCHNYFQRHFIEAFQKNDDDFKSGFVTLKGSNFFIVLVDLEIRRFILHNNFHRHFFEPIQEFYDDF